MTKKIQRITNLCLRHFQELLFPKAWAVIPSPSCKLRVSPLPSRPSNVVGFIVSSWRAWNSNEVAGRNLLTFEWPKSRDLQNFAGLAEMANQRCSQECFFKKNDMSVASGLILMIPITFARSPLATLRKSVAAFLQVRECLSEAGTCEPRLGQSISCKREPPVRIWGNVEHQMCDRILTASL